MRNTKKSFKTRSFFFLSFPSSHSLFLSISIVILVRINCLPFRSRIIRLTVNYMLLTCRKRAAQNFLSSLFRVAKMLPSKKYITKYSIWLLNYSRRIILTDLRKLYYFGNKAFINISYNHLIRTILIFPVQDSHPLNSSRLLNDQFERASLMAKHLAKTVRVSFHEAGKYRRVKLLIRRMAMYFRAPA